MKTFGYIESPYDSRDIIFSNIMPVSSKYNLKNVSNVKDQGSKPICAAISLATMINWQIFVKRDATVKQVKESNIFDLRQDKNQQGMIPREALSALKQKGVSGYKIKSYARVNNVDSAKAAILANGPLMACFMAYESDLFWKPVGEKQGGHAVVFTGWDERGFILQNSWGTSWQQGGTTIFPFEDWNTVIESWTIMI